MKKPNKVPSEERSTTLSMRLKEIQKKKNLKQKEIEELCRPYCKLYGVQVKANEISQYLNGKSLPGFDKLTILAKALNVSEIWLLGYDVKKHNTENIVDLDVSNEEIPIFGEIACGNPIFTDHKKFINLKKELNFDFCLKVKDDSLNGDHIYDGDIAFIKKQDIEPLNNGSIVAVIIEGNPTLKKIQYYSEKEIYILKSSNQKYNDLIYSKVEFEMAPIIFLGKVVAVTNRHISPVRL